MARRIARLILWAVAACYAYGALVHVLNIAGLGGFNWRDAPLKWQVLDIAYLILDVTVVAGLPLLWRAGIVAFYAAALSQILLYTVFRAWVIDVPEAFARSPDDLRYLDGLVAFHVVTLALVSLALWHLRSALSVRPAPDRSTPEPPS